MKTNGPGKYDAIATAAREVTNADAIVLIIANGIYGNGFSVQAMNPEFVEKLPDMLEAMAKQIREDLKATMQENPGGGNIKNQPGSATSSLGFAAGQF